MKSLRDEIRSAGRKGADSVENYSEASIGADGVESYSEASIGAGNKAYTKTIPQGFARRILRGGAAR